MNLDQIFKLIDAGYTKEEIQQLGQLEPEPEPKKQPEPEPKKQPELEPEPKKQPEPEPKKQPEPFDTQPFNKAIDEMTKAMNAMNVKLQKMALSVYEAPGQPEKTVESIIAKIIDPQG